MIDDEDRETIAEAVGECYEHPSVAENTPTKVTPPAIVLTTEQEEAVARIKAWHEAAGRNRDSNAATAEYRLGGYAGTGKTTVIKTIKALFEKDMCVSVAAFTGKAVNVLQRKGIRASTLHALMYRCEVINRVLHWHKRDRFEIEPGLIICDESSMINRELYEDLKSFGIPILFVGDPGQLEPVGDNPNLMKTPDFVLTKIHRQAEKSPIITLANSIRIGGSYPAYCEGDELVIQPKGRMDPDAIDQMICATNAVRKDGNDQYRRVKKLAPLPLVENEKIIVLKNNRDLGIFNGMIMFVTKIIEDKSDHWLVNAKDEIDRQFPEIPIWKRPYEDDQFDKDKNPIVPRVKLKDGSNVQQAVSTYGYVITCHKSQGSEWDRVLVLDSWMPPKVWDMRRWRYTAITRAAKKLIYCVDRW